MRPWGKGKRRAVWVCERKGNKIAKPWEKGREESNLWERREWELENGERKNLFGMYEVPLFIISFKFDVSKVQKILTSKN